MKFAAAILAQRKLIILVTLLLAISGAMAYLTMDRQEDPFFPYRAGRIIVPFPGAEPSQIERLVVRHLEEEIAQVEEVNHIEATMRTGVAVLVVELRDEIYETKPAWDRVREAMQRASTRFPDAVGTMSLDDRVISASTVVLAVTGLDDPLALGQAAEVVKDRVLTLGNIQKVTLVGDPGEQVTVALNDAVLTRLGITPSDLARQLSSRNSIIPGGTLQVAQTTIVLTPKTEIDSLEELRKTPITLPSGDNIPLAALARVNLGPVEPAVERFYRDGERAVGVDILTVADQTNQVEFGRKLRSLVAELSEQLEEDFPGVHIKEVYFQPDRVEKRLSDLNGNLLSAMGIILVVLFFAMGLRLGLVVSIVLPLVTAVTVGIFALGGNVLHQMAVIGLIVALGILIDNAIVMAEAIQWRINQGMRNTQAAVESVRELAAPLGAATGTTMAAFVPLLLSSGSTGDFTRAIPITIMIALTMSYLAAVSFTPIVAKRFLRPSKGLGKAGLPERFGAKAGQITTERPGFVLSCGAGLVLLAILLGTRLEAQFFPSADRNQLTVDFNLPEGAALTRSEQIAATLDTELRGYPGVVQIHTTLGSSGPRFYYNLFGATNNPGAGRLAVITTGLDANLPIIKRIREFARLNLPDVEVTAKPLAQGPPVDAPIEVRVFNNDPQRLARATRMIFAEAKTINGLIDVRHNLGIGVPVTRFEINDAVAESFGLDRQSVADALRGRSTGIVVGEYRAGDEPVPIKLRSMEGERFSLSQLPAISVYSPVAGPVPLMAIASQKVEWQVAAINHRDGRRTGLVSGQLPDGVVYTEVLKKLRPALAALELPRGTTIEYGGEAESSGEANTAIATAAPYGIMLLLFFLLLQFNSFRRVSIVMLTVPLAAVGVIPGLVFSGSPFGFQPLLGVISLVGIVVNNAIVLIDVVDQQLASGDDLNSAIRRAVERRTRPILLTTATTIAGLLPLALSDSTMWPPMAWAIISGLAASAFLTIFIIPAACSLWLKGTEKDFEKKAKKKAELSGSV